MEHVLVFKAALFDTKDEIDPSVYVLTHVCTFQGLPVFLKELSWGACPLRKLDVVDSLTIGSHAEV